MSHPTVQCDLDVVVVGGCGHVGLPLAIALASRGLRVGIYDINQAAVDSVSRGALPFREDGARAGAGEGAGRRPADRHHRPGGDLAGRAVVVVIGTPVDEHLNPNPHAVAAALEARHRRSSGAASSSCCAAPSTRA